MAIMSDGIVARPGSAVSAEFDGLGTVDVYS
jgi:hypothetical protein